MSPTLDTAKDDWADVHEIGGFVLKRTSYFCPEQYDVYSDGKQVGYMRLRHGYFSVRVPNSGGVEVYSGHPKGDGGFLPEEREAYLRAGLYAIAIGYLAA